ncbi:MAG: AmmeMemoRadiSam system protein B [Methanomassiliicoccales archaeon]|nr:AmmeMemoRadiSam system protein B [Methanomassiliicoccales archaeon]
MEAVEKCFLSPLGPGEIPKLAKGERKIVGAVVPHAGYEFSGPVAAHVYAELAKDGFPEAFVIIGPNHGGMGSFVAITTEDFVTPLGTCKIDKEMASKMECWVEDDPFAHQHEHSIEVQLPFIQYFDRNVKFLPITMAMQDYDTAKEVGTHLRSAIGTRDVVVIASTDFSHYVTEQKARTEDMKVIDQILALNPRGVYETVIRRDVSMCGYGPVMTMLEAVGGSEAKLLKYGTSGDAYPMPEVVGYGGIVVRR